MVGVLTDADYGEKTKEGVVFVDFWAPWCGPCRMQSPVVEVLAEEIDEIAFYKMNVDEEPETSLALQIRSIPTMIVLKDGEIVEKIIGFHDKPTLEGILKKYI